MHENADLSFHFISLVEQVNPRTIVLEEVTPYLKSGIGIATMSALRRMGDKKLNNPLTSSCSHCGGDPNTHDLFECQNNGLISELEFPDYIEDDNQIFKVYNKFFKSTWRPSKAKKLQITLMKFITWI